LLLLGQSLRTRRSSWLLAISPLSRKKFGLEAGDSCARSLAKK
jgi:hypothetical protein